MLIILLIVFSIRDFAEQKKSIFSNNYIKILTIIISGIFMIIPFLNIDYIHIDKLFTVNNICILILPIIVIQISYYIVNDYLAKKKLLRKFQKHMDIKYNAAHEVKISNSRNRIHTTARYSSRKIVS